MSNSAYQLRTKLFLAAFVLAPAIPTALAWLIIWAEPTPVPAPLATITLATAFAPQAGIVCYVVLGLPWIWYCAVRREPSPSYLAIAAMVANILSPVIALIQSLFFYSVISLNDIIYRDDHGLGLVLFIWFFGFIFAALWGALIAVVYRILNSAFPLSQNPA